MTWLLSFLGIPAIIEQVLRIVASLTESTGPLLKGIASGVVWFVQTLWDGIKDIVDSVSTIITVAFLCFCTWFYAAVPAKVEVAKCEKQVQVQKVYIAKQCPKSKTPKKEPEFFWPWE